MSKTTRKVQYQCACLAHMCTCLCVCMYSCLSNQRKEKWSLEGRSGENKNAEWNLSEHFMPFCTTHAVMKCSNLQTCMAFWSGVTRFVTMNLKPEGSVRFFHLLKLQSKAPLLILCLPTGAECHGLWARILLGVRRHGSGHYRDCCLSARKAVSLLSLRMECWPWWMVFWVSLLLALGIWQRIVWMSFRKNSREADFFNVFFLCFP